MGNLIFLGVVKACPGDNELQSCGQSQQCHHHTDADCIQIFIQISQGTMS